MLLCADEARQLARLVKVLMYGEQIAHEIATKQAQLRQASCSRTAKFLRSQARQEKFHYQVFKTALLWLDHRELTSRTPSKPLQQLRHKLHSAVSAEHYAESIFGLQLVLEGMGEAVLERLNSGIEKRQLGLAQLRRIILHQEQAHHLFGGKEYQQAILKEPYCENQHAYRDEYLDFSWQTFCELDAVFDSFNEDIHNYQAKVYSGLNHNLTAVT